MEKQIKSVLRKTVKIAGITCIALGGAALIASGAALKALTEGAEYLKDSVKKILEEKPEEKVTAQEHAPVETAEEETSEETE